MARVSELNRLTHDEQSYSVEGKVMAVLTELSRNTLGVVTKNSLLDAVCPSQSVAEGVLTRAIYDRSSKTMQAGLCMSKPCRVQDID